jgi:hypothetical protein
MFAAQFPMDKKEQFKQKTKLKQIFTRFSMQSKRISGIIEQTG